jgi:hypothetical protein
MIDLPSAMFVLAVKRNRLIEASHAPLKEVLLVVALSAFS